MPSYSRLDHDEAVRLCALKLVSDGHRVQARVEGWFDPPDLISGYRPDIIANMEGHFIIIEVKKGDIDWPKISALERFVSKNRAYAIKVITPDEILKLGASLDIHGIK